MQGHRAFIYNSSYQIIILFFFDTNCHTHTGHNARAQGIYTAGVEHHCGRRYHAVRSQVTRRVTLVCIRSLNWDNWDT
jgi:hypothetical protein